jgi:hypothetical protein
MKTILTTIITLFLYAAFAVSQTNYYTKTKTFYKDGYTYQCDVRESGMVRLYNKTNKWTYVPQRHEDLEDPYYLSDENYAPPFEDDLNKEISDWQRKEIVNNVLSEYRDLVKGRTLLIIMCIDSQTGKVSEVYFEFSSLTSPYAKIPVEVYRQIETQMLSIMGYTLTPIAKKMNYIYRSWKQEPE